MLIFPTYQTMLAKAAATSSGDGIVTSDLVLHLDANNYSGSGDWLDETSNDNDGTIVGATYTNDGDADYFDLDGSNDYISLGTGSDFKQQVPITISVWLSMDNFSGNQCLYGTYQNTSEGNLYNLFRFSGSTLYYFGSKTASPGYEYFSASVGTISADTWYQFTAVIDGSMSSPTLKLYKNTTSSSHSFSQAFVPTADLNNVDTRVGSNVYPDPLQGKIGVVMLYHKALSDSEVEQNFNHFKSRFGYVPPTLSSSTPADGATDFAVDGNIVLTFDKAVDADSGNIVIKKVSDNSTVETISVTGGQVSGSGTTQITINPSSDLTASTAYYINIDATAFDATSAGGGESYAGISDATTLNFTTAAAISHVTSDLWMHLDADSYSGSGDWLDATSNDNDGTIDGATYSAASGSNPAYFSFDGTDDGIEITDTYSGGTAGGLQTYTKLSHSNNFSISLWFQTASFAANTNWQINPILFKAGRRSVFLTHGIATGVNQLALYGYYQTGGWSQAVESDALSLDTWYNICFTYNTTDGFVCYQNGSSVDTNSSPNTALTSVNSNTFIGRLSDSDAYTSQRYWEGKMAIFSIYEKTLSSSEVTQNYNAFKSRYGLS